LIKLHRYGAEPEVGRRHLLHLDPRGLAVSCRRYRPLRPTRCRMGNPRSASQGTGIVGPSQSRHRAAPRRRPHSPCRPRQPILCHRLPG
jgi:hypothetical protein